MNHPDLDALMADAVGTGVFPGGAYAVGSRNKEFTGTVGGLTYEPDSPKVSPETVFDLASLTKVIATTTSAMCFYQDGALKLEAPVSSIIPGYPWEDVKVAHLLTHSSGLPAHRDFWKLSPETRWPAILTEPLEAAPGERSLYSCLGFLVLQKVLQAISGERYEEAWTWPFHRVAQAIGANLFFNPNDAVKSSCAPAEVVDGKALQGIVHDENARSLGGIAGNAGLFGSIGSVVRFAKFMRNGGEGLIQEEVIKQWTTRQSVTDPTSTRALGWDTKSEQGSSAGEHFGSRSYGHTGFTGTSIWIDPDAEVYTVLLTNRVHPTRENAQLVSFRPIFHNCVYSLLN